MQSYFNGVVNTFDFGMSGYVNHPGFPIEMLQVRVKGVGAEGNEFADTARICFLIL